MVMVVVVVSWFRGLVSIEKVAHHMGREVRQLANRLLLLVLSAEEWRGRGGGGGGRAHLCVDGEVLLWMLLLLLPALDAGL